MLKKVFPFFNATGLRRNYVVLQATQVSDEEMISSLASLLKYLPQE
jgi:hypothetical protein